MGSKCCKSGCCKGSGGGGGGTPTDANKSDSAKKPKKKCCRCCKCCTCKRCCNCFCFMSWIFVLTGITLLLLYSFWSCQIYRDITADPDRDVFVYWFTFAAIAWSTFWALIFAILATAACCRSKCCCAFETIWFVLHVGFCLYVAIYNDLEATHRHSSPQLIAALKAQANASGGALPGWYQYVQRRNFCCGVDGYAAGGCPPIVTSLQSRYPNMDTDCKPYLDRLYEQCRHESVAYVLTMMVLAVFAMMCSVVAYRRRVRLDAKEAALERRRERRKREREQLQQLEDDLNANYPEPELTPSLSKLPPPKTPSTPSTTGTAPQPTTEDLSTDLQPGTAPARVPRVILRSRSRSRSRGSSSGSLSREGSQHYRHRSPYMV